MSVYVSLCEVTVVFGHGCEERVRIIDRIISFPIDLSCKTGVQIIHGSRLNTVKADSFF